MYNVGSLCTVFNSWTVCVCAVWCTACTVRTICTICAVCLLWIVCSVSTEYSLNSVYWLYNMYRMYCIYWRNARVEFSVATGSTYVFRLLIFSMVLERSHVFACNTPESSWINHLIHESTDFTHPELKRTVFTIASVPWRVMFVGGFSFTTWLPKITHFQCRHFSKRLSAQKHPQYNLIF